MSIQEIRYKGISALSLEGGGLRATILPSQGAKLASLVRLSDGKELLAVKAGEHYRALSYDGDYVSSECSAFDDMFPTVDPYTPTVGSYKGVTYPDHGEVCRIPYAWSAEGACIHLRSASRRFPLQYDKRVLVREDALILAYDIQNQADVPFPFLWAGHIMLRGEDGMRLLTPFTEDSPTELMFGPEGAELSRLPKDRLMGFAPGEGAAYKFYYTEPMKEGRFGVSYPDGSALLFTVDEKKLPYLGIWLNNGAFQDMYSITPEPCSVPFDSPEKAAARGARSIIPPRASFSFEMKITLKEKNV